MTTISEVVAARRSTRSFKSEPVPLDTVRDILARASRAPSGGNLQPWHVYVLTGAAKDSLSKNLQKKYHEMPEGEDVHHIPYPLELADPYRTRRRIVGRQLFEILGIARGDTPGKRAHFGRNFAFFGAPVGLIFSTMRNAEPLQFVDLGIFIQTVMLLAAERGLATCPQGIFSMFHPTVEEILELPDDRLVVCGMSLGYADETAPVNRLESERAELDDFSVFLDRL